MAQYHKKFRGVRMFRWLDRVVGLENSVVCGRKQTKNSSVQIQLRTLLADQLIVHG